jgi:hypothetical protein
MSAISKFLSSDMLIGTLLLVILTITRSDHFGSSIQLPDASWAIFWLSGAWLLRWGWLAVLMIASVIVDYYVIGHGISSYCVTPAYPFLILTYLSLWVTGYWYATTRILSRRPVIKALMAVSNGVVFAFAISNVSFYLFAGYFGSMSAWHYATAVARYFPNFLFHTAMYVGLGLLVHYVVAESKKLFESARSVQ